MKVGLRLFLILFQGSDEDVAEIGGRCRCGRVLGHCNKEVTAQEFRCSAVREGSRARQCRWEKRDHPGLKSPSRTGRRARHCLVDVHTKKR